MMVVVVAMMSGAVYLEDVCMEAFSKRLRSLDFLSIQHNSLERPLTGHDVAIKVRSARSDEKCARGRAHWPDACKMSWASLNAYRTLVRVHLIAQQAASLSSGCFRVSKSTNIEEQ